MADKLKGGLADKKTIEDIARKHSQFVGTMKKALEKGRKVEAEHVDDPKLQGEIAMDHLWEDWEYYNKLAKMEGETQEEPKETTMAGSSGSFEPALSMPVMKRDIQNFKLKSQEFDEAMTASVSAGAMYDAPIGTKKKDPLALDNVSANESASITAASTKDMIATKKGFPRFGGPDAKFVEVKDKCKKFPYCNQMSGLDNLVLKEIHGMKDAIREAAIKYGITVGQVQDMILKESQKISEAGIEDIDFSPVQQWYKEEPKTIFTITTEEPIEFETTDEATAAKLHMVFSTHRIKFNIEERGIGEDKPE